MTSPLLLRIAKILGFLLGALCAAFAASALFLLVTWDGAQLQGQLTREFRDRLMRPLAMEQPPRLRFLPGPTVVIDGLALGNAMGSGIPVKAARVEASLAFFPLLRGHFEVERLLIQDPEVTLTREADGRLDLSDLANLADGSARPWPILWHLERLALERGRLEYLDGQKKTALRFERIALATGPLAAGSHGRISASASLTHGPGSASGGAELELGYHLDKQRCEIDFATLRFRGEALGATGIDATLAARGGQAAASEALSLRGLTLRGHGRFGADEMEVKAGAARIMNGQNALSVQDLEARLRLDNGQRRSDFELDLPSLAPREDGGEPFKLAIRTRAEHAEGEGDLVGRAAFRSTTGLIELSALGLHWRNRSPTWSAQLGGRLAFAPFFQRGEAQLQASLDAARLKLDASFDANRATPWQFDASGERIDLDRIAARLGQNPGALLATLAAAPTQGQIRFTNFATSGLRANELAATLTTQGGVLRADPLRAQLYGGSLSGSLRYQGANTLLALDQKFDGINLAALASDLHRPLPLRGELSGHWQLQSSLGRNTVASTSGRASLALRRAQWQGMDFDALLRSVRPALKGRGKAERASQPREHQDLDALAIDCAIASGSASCSGFSGGTPWLRLGGGGRLALSPAKLDWLLRIAVQSHGRIPREFKGLAGLTVPLRISGPLNRPLWRLDWDGAAPTATRQAPLRPQAPTAPASAAG